MSNELAGLIVVSIILAIVGAFMLVDSEGTAKRRFFWSEGDSPESLKALQRAVVLCGAILLIAGMGCLLLGILALILKSSS